MKVKELIEELKKCDSDLEVKVDSPYENTVNYLEEDKIEKAVYLLKV